MPAVEREISIVYGGYPVGGETNRQIHGYTKHSIGKDVASVDFDFTVQGDTSEDFASECLSAQSAFRTPYQKLTVTFGNSVVLSLSQSASTGTDAIPSIDKTGEEFDTGRSRMYSVHIEFGIPADKASMVGRRESTIAIEYSDSRRRTVTFAGTWTAIGSTDARAQYRAEGPGWQTTALSAVGGNYERIGGEDVEETTNDKTVIFRAVYHEILHDQSSSGTDDTGIVDPIMTIRRINSGPGDSVSPGVVRFAEMEMRFEAGIDNTVTKDLKAKWDAILSWLVAQILTYVQGSTFAAQTINVDFDEHENRISGTIRGLATDKGTTDFVECSISSTTKIVVGREIWPVWDGSVFDVYMHQGPAVLTRTVSIFYRAQGDVAAKAEKKVQGLADQRKGFPDGWVHTPQGSWFEIERSVESEPVQIGVPPFQLTVTDVTGTVLWRFVNDVNRSGASDSNKRGASTEAVTPGSQAVNTPRPTGT